MRMLMVSLLLSGAVVGALALVITLASPLWNRRYTARRRLSVWLLLGAALLVPFSMLAGAAPVQIELSYPTVVIEGRPQPGGTPVPTEPLEAGAAGTGSGTQGGSDVAAPAPVVRTGYRIHVFRAIGMVWLGGTLLLVLYELLRLAYWRRTVWRWRAPVRNGQVTALVEKVRADMHCRRPIRAYDNPMVQCPLVTGLFRPCLLLPEGFAPNEEGEMILRHEVAHIAAHDISKKTLLMAARALHWFNPLVWLMVRKAYRDIELACDERVVQNADKAYRIGYSQTLLECARQSRSHPGFAFCTGFADSKQSMMERLRRVLDTGAKHKGHIALAAVLLAVLITLNLILIKPAQRQDAHLALPAEGNYFSLVVGDGERLIQTPIPVFSNAYAYPEEIQNRLPAASVGKFLSVANLAEYAAQNYIAMYTSRDGGGQWERSFIDILGHMDMIGRAYHGYLDKENGYLIVHAAKDRSSNRGAFLYLTSDGGKTWRAVRYVSSPPAELVAAGFINRGTGLLCYEMVNRRPLIQITTDGGETWYEFDGLFPLLYEAAGAAPGDENRYYRCLSGSFTNGATLHFVEERSGTQIALHSPDGQNWSIASAGRVQP